MFVNISNHASSSWSKKQLEEAERLGDYVSDLPFPNVDPQETTKEIKRTAWSVCRPIIELFESKKSIVVMVQGEMSLTYHIVDVLKAHDIPCVVACSERKSVETVQEDGSTRKTSVFEFVQFREY